MLTLAVMLVALAFLFGLTALALAAGREVRHPIRTVLVLATLLSVGLALLLAD